MSMRLKFLSMIAFVILIDQLSKNWVLDHFAPYDPYALLSFLNITLVFNTGAAFSLLSGPALWHMWFFVVFAFIMVIVLGRWLTRLHSNEIQLGFAISLIIGGAISNVLDRLMVGQVVDFIDVYYRIYHWPVFNLADSAICLGAFWLAIVWRK
jgi:signal peptidase II